MKTKITILPGGQVYFNPLSGNPTQGGCYSDLSFDDDLAHCNLTGSNGASIEILPSDAYDKDECVEINGELYRPFSGTYGSSAPAYVKCVLAPADSCYLGCEVNFAFQTYTIPDELIIQGSDIFVSSSGGGDNNTGAMVYDDVIFSKKSVNFCSGSSSGSVGTPPCDCQGLTIPEDLNNYAGGCSPDPCYVSGSYYTTDLISTYGDYFIGSTKAWGCPVTAIVNAPLGGTAWNLVIQGCGIDQAIAGGGQGYFTWTGSAYDNSYYCNNNQSTSSPISHPKAARYVDPLNYGIGSNKTK